jgi:hypothetical protein
VDREIRAVDRRTFKTGLRKPSRLRVVRASIPPERPLSQRNRSAVTAASCVTGRVLVRNKGKEPVPHRLGLELMAGIDGADVEGVEFVGMADDVGGVRDSADGEDLDLADGRVIKLPPLVLERPAERRSRRDELRVELAVPAARDKCGVPFVAPRKSSLAQGAELRRLAVDVAATSWPRAGRRQPPGESSRVAALEVGLWIGWVDRSFM